MISKTDKTICKLFISHLVINVNLNINEIKRKCCWLLSASSALTIKYQWRCWTTLTSHIWSAMQMSKQTANAVIILWKLPALGTNKMCADLLFPGIVRFGFSHFHFYFPNSNGHIKRQKYFLHANASIVPANIANVARKLYFVLCLPRIVNRASYLNQKSWHWTKVFEIGKFHYFT